MDKYLIGIDIGGTKCAVVLGHRVFSPERTENFAFLDRICFPTEEQGGSDQVIAKIISSVNEILRKHSFSTDQLEAIGISCGGPLDHRNGLIQNPPNLYGWRDIPIVKIMEDAFGVPAYLQNDANACALAEWKYGAAKGYEDVIFLTFGTGLGAGLILNGQLYNGTNDMAGEVGHVRLEASGPVGYGKAGSFEGFCSGNGIAQLARIKVIEQLQMGIKPALCPDMEGLDSLTAKTVADAARQGDPLAQEIYSTTGHYLGIGLSMLIDILNPEIIVIGSVFERSGDLMQEAMREAIEKEALSIARKACIIVPAKLGNSIGDYATLSVALHGGKDGNRKTNFG